MVMTRSVSQVFDRRLSRRGLFGAALSLTAVAGFAACGDREQPTAQNGLRVAPDARHLLTKDGDPVFLVTDTGWNIMAGIDFASAKEYLDLRKEQGFNCVQCNLLPFDRTATTVRGTPFDGGGDLSRPREEWFAGCDEIVEYARSIDLILGLGLLWHADNGGSSGTTPPDDQLVSYGRFVGERYHDEPHLWFFVGGDDDPDKGAPSANTLGTALKDARADALITYHTWYKAPNARSWPWLGFYAFQWNSNSEPYAYEDARDVLSYEPHRPVYLMEPPYDPKACCGDDTDTSPQENRRAGWWAALSGTLGVAYGGPMDAWNSGAKTGGRLVAAGLERPQARQTTFIGTLLRQHDWTDLAPDWDGKVLVGDRGQEGSAEFAMAAASSKTVIAYTPVRRDLHVDLSGLGGSGTGTWYDPAAGTAVGEPQTGSGSATFTNPLPEDAVLVVTPS